MGNRFIDETGNTYGYLMVFERDFENPRSLHETMWKCQCKCGNIVTVSGADLRRGRTKSCGCLHQQAISKDNEIDLFEEYGFGIAFFNGKHSDEYFVFDIEDLDCVKDRSWYKSSDGYVKSHIRTDDEDYKKEEFLHRIILRKHGMSKDDYGDHIDHNKSDNRMDNLRPVSYSENNRNRDTIKNPSNTGIRNISYKERDGLYEFSTKINSEVYTFSSKDLQKVIEYANQFYIDHNLTEFLYKPEEDVRHNENFINFDINDYKYHPVYAVTRQYMSPPNPENIIKPFTIIDKDKYYGKK